MFLFWTVISTGIEHLRFPSKKIWIDRYSIKMYFAHTWDPQTIAELHGVISQALEPFRSGFGPLPSGSLTVKWKMFACVDYAINESFHGWPTSWWIHLRPGYPNRLGTRDFLSWYYCHYSGKLFLENIKS